MSRQSTVMAFVVIFLVALVARVMLLHTARFGGDEALFFRIGMDIVEGKHLPLLGTQITDGAARLPGPAFVWLMALPLALWRAPEAQYLFVEVLGAITVLVFMVGLRRPLGDRAALVAGAFYACAPWAILAADRTWNPNVMPFFVVVGLLAALRLRFDPLTDEETSPASDRASPWQRADTWRVVLVACLAILPHFHMSAPVAWAGLLVVAGPALWRRGPRMISRRVIVALLGVLGLSLVPLAISELSPFVTGEGRPFNNCRHLLEELVLHEGPRRGEQHPWGFVWVPVYALRFLTLDATYHALSGYWGGPDEVACLRGAFAGTPPLPFHPLRLLALLVSLIFLGATLFAGLFALVRRALPSSGASRDADDAPMHASRVLARATVAAVVVNTVLMGVAQKQVFGHYVFAAMPLVFANVATLALFVFALPRPGPRRIATTILVASLGIVSVGGLEVAWHISSRVDGRIGLEVHRRALQIIVEDADAAKLPQTDHVRLDFRGLRSSLYDWHIFATRALQVPLHFNPRAHRRRYVLTPTNAPQPPGTTAPAMDVGGAWLWRRP